MFIFPVISEIEAQTIFTTQKRRNPLSFFYRARFKRSELIHVPLHLFEVHFRAKDNAWSMVICCDAIIGETAIFQGQEHQNSEQPQGTVCASVLTPEQAEEQIRKYGRALVLNQAMVYGRKGSLHEIKFTQTVFYPYWVGYFEKGGRYDFRLADGITGQLQGPKMRRLFLQVLRQLS